MDRNTRSEETKRADTAEHELRSFSHIVSHDLTASLRHISEFSHLLMRDIGPDASAEAIAHSDLIQEATEKCHHMIEGLLAYSRVQQATLQCERSDMKSLAKLAAFQLSAEVQDAGATIQIGELGECVVDPVLMIFAFKLALRNSIKFTRPGARPHIDVHGGASSSVWSATIVDDGIGVALDRQEKMFGMFYKDQAEGAFPGVGAGLAICRRILRIHGGDVKFVGAARGASLKLSIPLDPKARLSSSPPL